MTDFVLNTDLDWRRLNRESAKRMKAVWVRAQLRYDFEILDGTDFVTDAGFAKLRAATTDGLRLILSFNIRDRAVPAEGSPEEDFLFSRVDQAIASFNGRVEVFATGNESVNNDPDDMIADGLGNFPAVEFQRRFAAHLNAAGHLNWKGDPLRIYAGAAYVAPHAGGNQNDYARALYHFVRDTPHVEGIDQHIYCATEAQVRNALAFCRGELGPTKQLAHFEAGFAPGQKDHLDETLETCIGLDWCTEFGRDPATTFVTYFNDRAADPATPAEMQSFVDGIDWMVEATWFPMIWDATQDYGPTSFLISTGATAFNAPTTVGAWPPGTKLIPITGDPPYALNTMHAHNVLYDDADRVWLKSTRLATYMALHEQTPSYLQAQADLSGLFMQPDRGERTFPSNSYYWVEPEARPIGGASIGGGIALPATKVAQRPKRRIRMPEKAATPKPITAPTTQKRTQRKGRTMGQNSQSDDEFLAEIRDWHRQAADFEGKVRSEMLDDLKFVRLGGDHQWPAQALTARRRPGAERPVLTDNRLKRYRTQVINKIRQNTPAIKVRPADDRADKKVADIYQGLIRNIENVSNASDALDKAVEFSVDCGRGYFGLRTEYASDDSFGQDICFRMIPDPFKVYFDPWSTTADGSDAKRAMIIEDLPRDQVELEYPDVELAEWPEGATGDRDWMSETGIRLAEYYEIIEEPADLVQLADGRTVWAEKATPEDVIVATRRSKRKTCRWYKIAGNTILEEGTFPSQYIPIIPVYGEECWLDGKHEINGLVRQAKDPQKLFNVWLSTTAEQVALQPKSPFVGPDEAFQGHEDKWATANNVNHAYLPYNQWDEQGRPIERPDRQPPPPVPTGYVEQMQVALDGIRAAVGMEDPSVGAGQGPDQSGRAIRSLIEQSDISTSHFADNLAKSVAHAGRILIEVIPQVFDTARVLRILGEDGEASHAEHDPEAPQPVNEVQEETGEIRKIYNLSIGRYDCIAAAGPSYTTKRQEGFDAMTQLAQAMPQVPQVAGDLIIRMSDMPYADQIADRVKASIPPQILAATESEDVEPELASARAQIEQLTRQLQMATDERAFREGELNIKAGQLQVQQFDAETKRMAAIKPEAQRPDGQGEFDVDERLAKLILEVEKGQREQEKHEREMQAPFPIPAANPLQGGGPIR
jgi:hypothetical protein